MASSTVAKAGSLWRRVESISSHASAHGRTGGRGSSGGANGTRTATGLPRLVITNRSPASTSASSLAVSRRNSLAVAYPIMGYR